MEVSCGFPPPGSLSLFPPLPRPVAGKAKTIGSFAIVANNWQPILDGADQLLRISEFHQSVREGDNLLRLPHPHSTFKSRYKCLGSQTTDTGAQPESLGCNYRLLGASLR